MTESEVIDAAREAGLTWTAHGVSHEHVYYHADGESLTRFASIICAKQREKDARICEENKEIAGKHGLDRDDYISNNSAQSCANAIRGQE